MKFAEIVKHTANILFGKDNVCISEFIDSVYDRLDNLPVKRQYKCVLCGNYKTDVSIACRGIGVCADCYPCDLCTTTDKCFEGKGSVDFVLAPYLYSGVVRKAVHNYKFGGQQLYGRLFGQMLCRELENIDMLNDYDMLVPVPLHKNRERERGYNQSKIIAEEVSKYLRISVNDEALIRVRDTLHQSSLKGKDRVENVRDAFYADMLEVRNKNIILVDDIYTMGETVKACADALKEAGAAKIIAVTLCKTMLEERDNPFADILIK